ncbi:MAG: hypothetical protein N2255_00145, partial [Kiritimatiellae bacterium]|nr:hypothetical protein [Kiritimatiellia bacterium]
MAQLSAYVELLPFIIPELVGYHAGQEPLLVQTIARTVRELCHRTRCLNTNSVPMRPLVIKDYRRSYVLPMPIDGVRIEALRGVKVNSIPIPLSLVRLTEGRAVSFECGSEPAELTSVCLSCGESGSDDVE